MCEVFVELEGFQFQIPENRWRIRSIHVIIDGTLGVWWVAVVESCIYDPIFGFWIKGVIAEKIKSMHP